MNTYHSTIHHLLSVLMVTALLSACANVNKKPPAPASPTDINELIEYSRQLITNERQKNKIVGLSVALVDGDSTIWSDGYGFHNAEKKLLSNPHTLYRAGSISKLITTIAILQLVDQNQIDLDSPVQKYLPDFFIGRRFSNDHEITIRALLTHHSGLPTNYLTNMWATPQVGLDTLLGDIKQEYATHPPELVYSYSNLAFSILGLVVERMSEKPFAQYAQENIFTPLNMSNTNISGKVNPNISNSASGYLKGKAITTLDTRDTPATGLNSHVLDLTQIVKWVNKSFITKEPQLISYDLFEQMFAQQNKHIELDFTKRTGLGWKFYDNYLGRIDVYGHDGRTIAHSSLLLVEPKSQIGVIVMANSPSENGGVYRIARQILRKYYKIKTNDQIVWRNAVLPKEPYDPPYPLAGNYATTLGNIEIIEKSNRDSFRLRALGRRFKLKKDKQYPSTYRVSYKLLGLFPVKLGWIGQLRIRQEQIKGYPVLVGYIGAEKRLLGTKISRHSINDSWAKRVGRYSPKINLQPEHLRIKHIDLLQKRGFYFARVKLHTGEHILHTLKTLNDNEAVVAGLGRRLGDTLSVKHETEKQTTIRYLGLEFIKK